MTVNTTPVETNYTGNASTTVFALTFAFAANAHVKVYLAGVLQNSGYSITGAGNPSGGTLTFSAAPGNGVAIKARRVTPLTQEIDVVNNATVFASSLEVGLDYALMRQQEETFDRLALGVSVAADAVQTAADRVQTGLDRVATAADRVQTGLATAATAADLLAIQQLANAGGDAPSVIAKLDRDLTTLAAIKAKSGAAGDVLLSTLYGSTWELASPVRVQATTITADDELFQLTAASGTWAAQIGSLIGQLRKKAAENKARACAKMAITGSLASNIIINVLGDSITYGQVPPALTGGDRVATGFGDGSLHEWSQTASPWPAELEQRLIEVLGPKFTVNNRGLSGNRIENVYTQTRTAPVCDITLLSSMVNDNQFATQNGGTDGTGQLGLLQATSPSNANASGLYAIQFYVDGMFKVLAREILRGSWPFVVIESPYQSLLGYDATNYAAARLLRQFAIAARSVADALGLPVIDFAERVSAYDINTATHDGIHPTPFGHELRGAIACAAVIGESIGKKVVHSGGTTRIGANVTQDPVVGYRASSNVINTPNANSFGRPFFSTTAGPDIILNPGDDLYLAVYLETDEAEIYPVGAMSNGGSGSKAFNQIVDFGLTQPVRKLAVGEEVGAGVGVAVPATRTISVATTTNTHFNHPSVRGNLLRLQGRGWHLFCVSSPAIGGGAFVLSGFEIGDFGFWREVTLAAGFTQYGNIAPAVRLEDGLLYARGSVVCAVPATLNQTITTLTGYSRVTFRNTEGNITLPYWHYVELGWTGMNLIWKTSPGANLINLAELPPRPVLILDDT